MVGYSPWGHREPDMTEQLSMHACTYVPVVFHQQLILNLTLCIYYLILNLQLRKLNVRTLT